MKHQADKKRKDVHLEVGDLVLVEFKPYRQHMVALKKNQKLSLRFFGPFKILVKVRQVANKFELPEGAKIHSTFHIS